jgi:ABC-type nitrate/sulfonate/bicarbonate transport system substrate-binding protein
MQNPSPISVTIVSRNFERENPDVVARLADSFEAAILSIRKNPDGARQHLANYTKLSPAVISRVTLVPDTTPKETDTAALQAFAELMNKIGEVPKRIDVSSMVGPVK